MTRIVVPLASFRLFDAAITRRAEPFSSGRMFAEFSSLVEAIVLADEVLFFNVGAYQFEWSSGSIIGVSDGEQNPFAPFHGTDFILPLPYPSGPRRTPLIEMLPESDRQAVFDMAYRNEPRHDFSLWQYLSAYSQAYNGDFGDVVVKEYPLISAVIDKLFRFSESTTDVARDPLVLQAYENLKKEFAKQIEQFSSLPVSTIVLPPITATLLSRLPDNTDDPYIVMEEVFRLREELAGVRARFQKYQDALYDDKATIQDLKAAHSSVESDANALRKKFAQPYYDQFFVRWFIDNVSFAVKLLIKQQVAIEDIGAAIGRLLPSFSDRLSARAPCLLFDMAMKTRTIEGYATLAERKLGLKLP